MDETNKLLRQIRSNTTIAGFLLMAILVCQVLSCVRSF